MSNRRGIYAALLLVMLFAFALSFPGVRAAASDFLGLFRVQKFTAISISPAQLHLLEQIAESGLYPGEIRMTQEPGEPRSVASVEEAAELAGRPLRLPAELAAPQEIYVMNGGSGQLIVNVQSARAIIRAAGADPGLIPDSLDGKAVSVTAYPTVGMTWDDVALMQSASPLVEYPEDVDVVAIGEALLQALGMPAGEARRLARNIDWTNTLLLPIPENVATFSEIRVDGVSGLALNSLDGRSAGLLWQKDGIVYALSGSDVAELVKVADSMR